MSSFNTHFQQNEQTAMEMCNDEVSTESAVKTSPMEQHESAQTLDISQQLFPNNAASTGKNNSIVTQSTGIDVEDFIESPYISTVGMNLSVERAVVDWKLDRDIARRLEENGIEEFFPVQTTVIPELLRMNLLKCVFPRDVCVAAPTGSG